MSLIPIEHVDINRIASVLGVDRTSALRRAVKGKWPYTKDAKGRHLYTYKDLPGDLQVHIQRRTARELGLKPDLAPATNNRIAAIQARAEIYDRLPAGNRKEAERRMGILRARLALLRQGMGITEAETQLVAQVKAEGGACSLATLHHWKKKVKGVPSHLWLAALAPDHKGRTKKAECSPEVWECFKADFLRLEKPAAAVCYERIGRLAKVRGWIIPSLKTLKRRLEEEVPHHVIAYAREGDEALRRLGPSQERDRSHLLPMDAVNADGHKFDVFVKLSSAFANVDGKIVRPILVAWQDLSSGKIIGWRIGQTESSDLVRLSLADAVRAYGIPRDAYLDNGRAFASKFLTGGAPTRYRFKVRAEDPLGVITGLGIEPHWTTPYHGQAKPIERAFGDLCEHIAKHPQLAGCYTGNNPNAKPENYGSRAVPWDEFVALVDREIAAHNARTGRRAAACMGRSFDATFADGYARAKVRKATEVQLRTLLLCSEAVTVSSYNGQVALGWNHYWSEATAQQAGKKVLVRFDPDRLGNPVLIYTMDGAYLGEAACTRQRFDSTEAARDHSRAKKQFKRAAKAQLEATRAMNAAELAEQLAVVETPKTELPEARVIEAVFPQRPAEYVSPLADADMEQVEKERRLGAFLGRISSGN
jgi:transposase InsO family protein